MAEQKHKIEAASHRAVLLGDFSPITARLLWTWLERGHRIDAFWACFEPKMASLRLDRQLAVLRPGWSVSAALKRHGIQVVEVTRDRLADDASLVRQLSQAGLLIACMFPLRVPPNLLAAVDGKALNLHPALLPAWRGSAPIHSMIQAGRAAVDGGITLHLMIDRFDAGAIVSSIAVPLRPGQSWRQWRQALARAAGAIVDSGILPFLAGEIVPRTQGESPTPYSRIADRRFVITPAMTARQADDLLTIFGHAQALELDTGLHQYRVVGRLKQLGPPTGQAAKAGPLTVSMDLADARCRFRRRLPGANRRSRLRLLWSLIRARY